MTRVAVIIQIETWYWFQWEVDHTVINCFAFSKIFLHINISIPKKQLEIISHTVWWKKMELKILVICLRPAKESMSGLGSPVEMADWFLCFDLCLRTKALRDPLDWCSSKIFTRAEFRNNTADGWYCSLESEKLASGLLLLCCMDLYYFSTRINNMCHFCQTHKKAIAQKKEKKSYMRATK